MPMKEEKKKRVVAGACSLLGLPKDTPCEFELMDGGMTGDTFRLTPSGEAKQYVVRRIRGDEAGNAAFIAASTALAKAGISPAVIAADQTMIISELVSGTPCTAGVLAGNADTIAAVGALTARLHSCDPTAIGHAGTPRDNELAFWWKKAEPHMGTMPEKLTAFFAEAVEQGLACGVSGPAGAVVPTHGDLHMGNVLLPSPATGTEGKVEEGDTSAGWLVDLEHVASNRIAGSDIAYFFSVWGDYLYMAGWKASADQAIPYAPLDQRRAFARSYLAALGDGSTPSDTDVDDFLFQVEVCGERQRVRLMMIWIILCKGDPTHPIGGGATKYLPHAERARKLLVAAAGGDADLRARILALGCTGVAALLNAQEAAK